MRKANLYTADAQMLKLLDILKAESRIRFTQDFCDTIELKKQNIRAIRMGTAHLPYSRLRPLVRLIR